MASSSLSKEFFELIKSIGDSKSKQEEDRIIQREVSVLKKKMGDSKLTGKRLKEFLIRMVYVEMLGHDASFGYIKAVELTASTVLLEKRVGYLCAGLCFSPENEFRIMLVNRMQQDLQNPNVLVCSAALSAAAKLATSDMIPALVPLITGLLRHDQEIVRRKSVMVLHRFHQLSPPSVADMGDQFRRALCDKNPSVMAASLHALYELAKVDVAPLKDLAPSLVSILKQIIDHSLPRDFDYHRMPAPWLQMKLLQLLGVLGASDQAVSEQIYEVLLDVMRRADTGINVGFAIIYECVRTVTSIYPNATLLDAAASAIGRFIQSDNHNLKYLGVTGLAAIAKDHAQYAAEHQLAVIDCLEDPDETLKRKTLDLLYRMINPVNVEPIVDKLVGYLRAATDVFFRKDLVARITDAAERYAPSNSWYIHVMTTVFELGGELVRPDVAHGMMRLIAETGADDTDGDENLCHEAVESYLVLLRKTVLPTILLKTIFWVLGEYGYLASSCDIIAVTRCVCEAAYRTELDDSTRSYALSAVTKLTAQLQSLLPEVDALLNYYAHSKSADLAQKCHELRVLVQQQSIMVDALPVDASCEDLEVDESLTFLDSFVADALAAGAKTYSPPALEEKHVDEQATLRFDAYEKPDVGSTMPVQPTGPQGDDSPAVEQLSGLNISGVKQVWGAAGYQTPATAVAKPDPEPAAAPAMPMQTYRGASGSPAPAPAPAPEAGAGLPAAKREALKPRELSEREKMAAALFGGVPIGASPVSARNRGATGTQRTGRMRQSPASTSKPAASSATGGSDDLFGLFGANGSSEGGPASGAPKCPDWPSSMTSVILSPSELGPHVPSVGGQDGIRVYCAVVHTDAHVGVAVAAARSTAKPVEIVFELPGFLSDAGSSLRQPAGPSEPLKFMFDRDASAVHVLQLVKICAPPTERGITISIRSDGNTIAQHHAPIHAADLLRPFTIPTPKFGELWLRPGMREKLAVVPSAVKSPADFMARMPNVRFHPVEMIEATSEAIAAARLMGSEQPCLVHARMSATGVEARVRTPNEAFTSAVLASICTALG